MTTLSTSSLATNLKSHDIDLFCGGNSSTSALKSIAQGFLAMIAIIWFLSAILLVRAGDGWLGILYLLILLLPLSAFIVLRMNRKHIKANQVLNHDKRRNILFSVQGVALACWVFDLTTTHYAIDITGFATELNPLGWPLGILGALAYYGPTVAMMYILLFKINQKSSIYVGYVLSTISLWMGAMNFSAGIQNFGVFLSTAYIMPEFRLNLLALVIIAEGISIVGLTRLYGGNHLLRTARNSPN